MKRIQVDLEESIWLSLQAKAQIEQTTISALVRKAVQAEYFNPLTSRAKAMQALVGIRKTNPPARMRRLRSCNRLSRVHPNHSEL